MGDLANKQISQTYDGLIQTGTDNSIDGTLRPLQDGSGNNLPIEVSTTGVNFTGTVSGIDTGVQSVVAGTNVTVDATDPANPIISATGGGGGATQTVFTNGTVVAHTGADPQGVLIDSILVPANTITGPAVLKWECPLIDGPEGAFTYTSVLLSANAPINEPQYDLFLGRQQSGGGPDGYNWQRMMTVDNNGNIHLIDHNNYSIPSFSADGMITRAVDWTLDQYFSIGIFIESTSGVWTGYSPSLTIMQ